MKLHATMIPYTGTVAGGLMFSDEAGVARFMVPVVGLEKKISKEQATVIARALIIGIPEPIEVPDA